MRELETMSPIPRMMLPVASVAMNGTMFSFAIRAALTRPTAQPISMQIPKTAM